MNFSIPLALVIAQTLLLKTKKIKDLGDSNINKTIETLSKITKTIQDRVMSLRMVAIRDTFEDETGSQRYR